MQKLLFDEEAVSHTYTELIRGSRILRVCGRAKIRVDWLEVDCSEALDILVVWDETQRALGKVYTEGC